MLHVCVDLPAPWDRNSDVGLVLAIIKLQCTAVGRRRASGEKYRGVDDGCRRPRQNTNGGVKIIFSRLYRTPFVLKPLFQSPIRPPRVVLDNHTEVPGLDWSAVGLKAAASCTGTEMAAVGLLLVDLHSAAKQNDIMGAVKLLEEGAQIDKRDPYG